MIIIRHHSRQTYQLQRRARVTGARTPVTTLPLRRNGSLPQHVLIVEDEYLIAADLESQMRDDGATVARVALSVDEARRELETNGAIAGVILDINVGGVTSFGLADALKVAGVPFIFFTGYHSMSIPDRFIAVPRIAKPAAWPEIKEALTLSQERIRRTGLGSFRDSIEAALPRLRGRAHGLAGNPEDGDALVERTLERAISVIANRSLRLTIEDWLLELLERTDSENRMLH